MAGILYLCICFLTGNVLLQVCFPVSLRETKLSFWGEPVKGGKRPIPGWFVRLPASFLIGTLAVTWAVYLTAYCARSLENPLRFANAVVMGAAGAALAVYYGIRFKRQGCRIPGRSAESGQTAWHRGLAGLRPPSTDTSAGPPSRMAGQVLPPSRRQGSPWPRQGQSRSCRNY